MGYSTLDPDRLTNLINPTDLEGRVESVGLLCTLHWAQHTSFHRMFWHRIVTQCWSLYSQVASLPHLPLLNERHTIFVGRVGTRPFHLAGRSHRFGRFGDEANINGKGNTWVRTRFQEEGWFSFLTGMSSKLEDRYDWFLIILFLYTWPIGALTFKLLR